jgi:CHAT domain-containing protein
MILHIATHGFSSTPPYSEQSGEEMFHTGLMLAGANVTLTASANDNLSVDGVLTGEEAAALNLSGTELVVLSACRTGLGLAVAGEGIFGLHRAIACAGARCVMMSLWKIPDAETAELMSVLYEELTQGRSRSAALREAKRRMREQHSHPYFWAGFLCLGDSTAIQMLVDRVVQSLDARNSSVAQHTSSQRARTLCANLGRRLRYFFSRASHARTMLSKP